MPDKSVEKFRNICSLNRKLYDFQKKKRETSQVRQFLDSDFVANCLDKLTCNVSDLIDLLPQQNTHLKHERETQSLDFKFWSDSEEDDITRIRTKILKAFIKSENSLLSTFNLHSTLLKANKSEEDIQSAIKNPKLVPILFDMIFSSERISALYLRCVAGAEIDQIDSNGYTPLMLASKHGDVKAIALLIIAGANVNMQNPSSSVHQTALTLAARAHYNARESVKLLCQAGADENLLTTQQQEILHDVMVKEPRIYLFCLSCIIALFGGAVGFSLNLEPIDGLIGMGIALIALIILLAAKKLYTHCFSTDYTALLTDELPSDDIPSFTVS